MALGTLTSVTIRPERLARFMESVGEMAAAARERGETWNWTAHQTLFGETLTMHFASQTETFEQIESRGTIDELWHRVLGDSRGPELFQQTNECIQTIQQQISNERPDLSYAPEPMHPAAYPYAAVTAARSRMGHTDTCEELIRKVAEAIPKVGDPARMNAYQVIIGEIGLYWTVRPMKSLSELDAQLPAPELLNQAFGTAEGGLIWRSGTEAVQEGRREIVRYTPELSNPAGG